MTIQDANATIARDEAKIFLLSNGRPTSKLAARLAVEGWTFWRSYGGRSIVKNADGIAVIVAHNDISMLAELARLAV